MRSWMLDVLSSTSIRLCPRWPPALRFFSKACWEVSSHGRVRDSGGRISQGCLNGTGYRRVMISGQNWPVHRVVKITFHGLPKSDEAWQVHHLDGNKANNCLDNLEYVTPRENVWHSFCSATRRRPVLSKSVLWRTVGSTNWTRSPSATAAAQQLGMCKKTVAESCRKLCAAKGYEFKYQELHELTLPGEEWQQMVDPTSGVFVPGRMVSSFGRTTTSRTGLIGRGHLTQDGYYRTCITVDSHCKNVYTHRLVAFAFLGPPPCDHQTFVNHKDRDKGNNAVDNLEWVSASENQAHSYATSTRDHTTTPKSVWSRRHGTEDLWSQHRSMTSAALELGLRCNCISRCTRGLQRQTGGYEFQLADAFESSLLGEEWRTVDLLLLQKDREFRSLCFNR